MKKEEEEVIDLKLSLHRQPFGEAKEWIGDNKAWKPASMFAFLKFDSVQPGPKQQAPCQSQWHN